MLSLASPRLLLRELAPGDAPAIFEVLSDPETMRWYPRGFTHEEIDEWIGRQISRYCHGTGLLGITLTESGALIGDCGPVWQDVEGVRELEIGYHVHHDYRNRGYATEAARAIRDYAFDTLCCDHVISIIRPENLASRRVAEKNGLKVARTVFWRDYDSCVYQLSREEA